MKNATSAIELTGEQRDRVDEWAANLREQHAELRGRPVEELDQELLDIWRRAGMSDDDIRSRLAAADLDLTWPLPAPSWVTEGDLGVLGHALEVSVTWSGSLHERGKVSAWIVRTDILTAEHAVDPAGTHTPGPTVLAYAAPEELTSEDALALAAVLTATAKTLRAVEAAS